MAIITEKWNKIFEEAYLDDINYKKISSNRKNYTSNITLAI